MLSPLLFNIFFVAVLNVVLTLAELVHLKGLDSKLDRDRNRQKVLACLTESIV